MKKVFSQDEIEILQDNGIFVVNNSVVCGAHINTLICDEYIDVYNIKKNDKKIEENIKILRDKAIKLYTKDKIAEAIARHNTNLLGMLGLTLNSDGTIENENI